MQTHRNVSMSSCGSGVGGTKWAGDNKDLWYFGYFDLKGLLGSTKI